MQSETRVGAGADVREGDVTVSRNSLLPEQTVSTAELEREENQQYREDTQRDEKPE